MVILWVLYAIEMHKAFFLRASHISNHSAFGKDFLRIDPSRVSLTYRV